MGGLVGWIGALGWVAKLVEWVPKVVGWVANFVGWLAKLDCDWWLSW
jgi:hypothetical protein